MDTHIAEHTRKKETKRAHVAVPRDLLEEVDALVGPRRRSEFFVEAVRERVARERQRKVMHEMAGALKHNHIPEWDTPESTSAWVHALRVESDRVAFGDDSEA